MAVTHTISAAQKVHAPAMAAMLADAFVDEPAMAWMLPDTDRHERLKLFFPPMVRGAIANGFALRSPNDEAVTLWRVPPKIDPAFFETLSGLPEIVKALKGEPQKRAQALSQALKAKAPPYAYWRLQFAGVAPAHQGKGWGGAAIRAGLERARAAGMPVYVDTSKAANMELYSHLGFKPFDYWEMPNGGPPVWMLMFNKND